MSTGVSSTPVTVSPGCRCRPSSGSWYRVNGTELVISTVRSRSIRCLTTRNHRSSSPVTPNPVERSSGVSCVIPSSDVEVCTPILSSKNPYSTSTGVSNWMDADELPEENAAVSQRPRKTNSCLARPPSFEGRREPSCDTSSPRAILFNLSRRVYEVGPILSPPPRSQDLTRAPITSPLSLVIGPPLMPPMALAVEDTTSISELAVVTPSNVPSLIERLGVLHPE